MKINNGILAFISFLIIIAITILYFGWADSGDLLTFGMGFIGLSGLTLLLKLPWDLYFEARTLVAEQTESCRKAITISEVDQRYAQTVGRRLLFLCLGLHLLATLVTLAVTYFSGGYIGYYFSGFFLLSTGFRPLVAYYCQQKARFAALRHQCRVPREDAINFAARIKELEEQFKTLQKAQTKNEQKNQQTFQEVEADIEQLHATSKRLNRVYQEKVDRVCDEFDRAVEKLSEDKELLSGLRALVKMIKTG